MSETDDRDVVVEDAGSAPDTEKSAALFLRTSGLQRSKELVERMVFTDLLGWHVAMVDAMVAEMLDIFRKKVWTRS